jgi:CheY-like chemotaxis protein
MARALSQTDLTDQQRDHVDMLVRSGDGLMTILNDLLDTSKAEAGKLELESIPFDLHELGQRVHDLWTEVASAKGVRLTYEDNLAAPFWVSGDPTRLRQVLINLISNALKFTTEGEVRLGVSHLGADGEHEVLKIEVSDTGIGLTEEQASRLFKPFVQADQSTARRFGGTGLGLSICQDLVSLMGSEVTVDSRCGHGSTFRFILRLPRAAEAAPDCAPSVANSLQGMRILVADDNAINLAVARAVVEAFGATVTTASDGQGALDQLRNNPFDAVLMDVHMPVLSGIDALKRIRSGEAGPTDVPVIALTADAMAGVDQELMACGFDAVEPKPITPASLLLALTACTARAHDADAADDLVAAQA